MISNVLWRCNVGILEQCNSIPTYCPETFTYEDLIRCIYELFNYKKMNEETIQETYSLNDDDIEEVLNNMEETSTTTEETSEEPVAVEPVDFEDDEEDNSEEYEDDDEEENEEPQEELTVENSLQRIKRIITGNADEEHSRFKGAPWYEIIRQKVIMIAGMGGIGSWNALLIARLNPKAIWVYDDDMVEIANMSGQLYGIDDCGKYKTSAIIDTIKRYTTFNDIFEKRERITSNSESADIMVCGFDNMAARKTYFTLWIKHVRALPEEKKKDCLFIDGRLSIDVAQVFTIRGDDEYSQEQYYRKYLFDDWQAESTQCSLKQTSFMASFIGSIMTNMLVNFCTEDGELPFKTEYNSKFVLLKRED